MRCRTERAREHAQALFAAPARAEMNTKIHGPRRGQRRQQEHVENRGTSFSTQGFEGGRKNRGWERRGLDYVGDAIGFECLSPVHVPLCQTHHAVAHAGRTTRESGFSGRPRANTARDSADHGCPQITANALPGLAVSTANYPVGTVCRARSRRHSGVLA